MGPPDDPEALDPDYPPEYTPEERVDHVLGSEYPRRRSLEWLAAAADTDIESVRSVLLDRLAEGEVEISENGVRRNRYFAYFERVERWTEQVREE